jgi:dTDP-4-dehydrorhamnose reductase
VLRVVVTGRQGQVVRSLTGAGPEFGVEVVTIGRPELDLALPAAVEPLLAAAQPDIIVNAASYTAVDRAEQEPDTATAINVAGAGAVAAASAKLKVPLIHFSTDYVFDGSKATPYTEEDPVAPTSVYGASKLAGERMIAAALTNHVILRTAWVYAPYGKNFVRTMLTLAQTRDEVRVVADQIGCPTYAPDIAVATIAIARNLLDRPDDARLHGTFNLTGSGETSWADFAAAIFTYLKGKGMRTPILTPITTAEYPTPARRPANSRLDCAKLRRVHGIELPSWTASLPTCLDALTCVLSAK